MLVGPSVLSPLAELAEAARSTTRASRHRMAAALIALVWVLAVLMARSGTARGRLGGAALMGGSLVAAVGWGVVERRRMRDPAGILRVLGRPVDRDRSDRALRALSLLAADGQASDLRTSAELARLHVTRALALLPTERMSLRASRLASRLRSAALVLGVVAAGIAFANIWAVLEGVDVLVARAGVAPFTMHWLDETQVVARPPDYLHEPERSGGGLTVLSVPYGSLVTVRGTPVRPARRLFLSDASTEIPFVEDGAGGVVARWPLVQSAELRVVARFGGVVIPQSEALSSSIHS